VELTELIRDYVATELLSSIELDFLEGELWDTSQHIAEINTVIKAPKNICKKLDLDEKSCWQLCCAAILDSSRPLKNGQKRVDNFKKLIKQLYWDSFSNNFEGQLAAESSAQTIAGKTEDSKIGVMSFIQKKKAEFKGK